MSWRGEQFREFQLLSIANPNCQVEATAISKGGSIMPSAFGKAVSASCRNQQAGSLCSPEIFFPAFLFS
jgi:hypothetical protein